MTNFNAPDHSPNYLMNKDYSFELKCDESNRIYIRNIPVHFNASAIHIICDGYYHFNDRRLL